MQLTPYRTFLRRMFGHRRPARNRRHNPAPMVPSERLEIRTLMTVPLDAFEFDDRADSARTITINAAAQTHTLHVGADVDWVRFEITEASRVILETSGASGDTTMRLFGPTTATQELAYDDDGGEGAFSRIVRVLDPGLYFASVAEYTQNDAIASYTLRVSSTPLRLLADAFEPDDARAQAISISTNNLPQVHSLHRPLDADWLKFQVTATSVVSITANETSSELGSTLMNLYVAGSATPLIRAASYDIQQTLLPGSYELAIYEDGLNGIVERYSVAVSAVAVPDLVVTQATTSATGSLLVGGNVTVNWTGSNLGPGSTGTSGWTDRIYLSADAQLGGDQSLYSEYVSESLAASRTYSRSRTVTLPSDLAWAGKSAYLIVVADDYDSITEARNDNNTRVIPIQFAPHIEVVAPFTNQFVDSVSPLSFQVRAIDGTGTSVVRLAIDTDANPNNGSGHQWLATPQTLNATTSDRTQSASARLPQLPFRSEPYYVWAQLSNANGTWISTPHAVYMTNLAVTSVDPLGDTIGGSGFEVFGIDSAQVDDLLLFRVRTNYDPQKSYQGNSSGGGDLLLTVGNRRYGLAVNTHAAGGNEVVAGDLYAGATFLNGTNDSTVPTFLRSYTQRISGQSSVRYQSVSGLAWSYEVVGAIRLAALGLRAGESVSLSWAMYCGNDTDDVTIQPTIVTPPPTPPDLVARTLTDVATGGLSFTYQITGANLTTGATASVYWANGSGQLLGSPVFSQTTETTIGTHGPVSVPGSAYSDPPAGATQLVLVLDNANSIAESNESNNRVATTKIDPDDQISEAIALGAITTELPQDGRISLAMDVDMYSITVQAGQRVAFDLDGFGGTIRLFNAQGQSLTNGSNSGGPAPRENGTREGYLERTFESAGTYFVGVSGLSNVAYNANTGVGDRSTNQGSYRLVITPITYFVTAPDLISRGVNQIDGRVMMPNPANHASQIPVTLTRIGNQSIVAASRTWVVIHGRNDNPTEFRPLANALANATGDQVLLLDWAQGASDNSGILTLDGADWIPYVADWTASAMKQVGITGQSARLVGHSWGSYLAYELALTNRLGRVQTLVALDPAGFPVSATEVSMLKLSYPASRVNFSAVSNVSWSIYGSGLFGSARLAGTANEAFHLNYFNGEPGDLAMHRATVDVFEFIVLNNSRPELSPLFSLSYLQGRLPSRPWRSNAYADGSDTSIFGERPQRVFEGVFRVIADTTNTDHPTRDDHTFWRLTGFRYFDRASGREVVVS